MSDGTNIEWTDATWNVVVGCDKVSSGCSNCFAIRTAHRMQSNPNPKVSGAYAGTEVAGEWTGRVNLLGERLDWPLLKTKPRRIFVTAQSDLFHKGVPDEFVAQVWVRMALTQRHPYQVLSKRPGRMRSLLSSSDFVEMVSLLHDQLAHDRGWDREPMTWPLPNVAIGVSVEDQTWADVRIPLLQATPAAVRFLSCEPLLGPVLLCRCDGAAYGITRYPFLTAAACPLHGDVKVDWVIAGGESGPGSRPMHPQWARSLRNQCEAVDVPFFFKQWGDWVAHHSAGDAWAWTTPQAWVSTKGDVVDTETAAEVAGGDWAGVWRVGKRRAGHLLDGQELQAFPRTVAVS